MTQPWEISCSPDAFAKVRDDEAFAALVALARCSSQLRWAYHALDPEVTGEDSLYAARQRTGTINLTAATLHEGIILVKKKGIGKHFKGLASFAAFPELWKDQELRPVLEMSLEGARNQFVFHFDPAGAATQMNEITFSDHCIFALGIGETAALAMLAVVGIAETPAELDVKALSTVACLARAAGRFLGAADALIAEALPKFGFEFKVPEG